MDKQEILDYVMHTPGNTNPNVLGTMLDGISGSEGGNPNRIQVINGTAANPWGDIDTFELYTAIANGEATAKIIFDGSSLGVGNIEAYLNTRNNSLFANGGNIDVSGEYSTRVGAYMIAYSSANGSLETMTMAQNGNVTDMSAYASNFNSTLSIIWHPHLDSNGSEELTPADDLNPTNPTNPISK